MPDVPQRQAAWSEVHAVLMESERLANDVRAACGFDWAALPITEMGTRWSGANLTSAVMRTYPSAITLDDGRQVYWEEFKQRDINAHRLTGGVRHPFETVRQALAKMEAEWPWSAQHRALLRPNHLLSGHLDMRLKGELVEAEVVVLPPVECTGILRSKPIGPDDASCLALLWYQDEFGIAPEAVQQIRALSWNQLAYSFGY